MVLYMSWCFCCGRGTSSFAFQDDRQWMQQSISLQEFLKNALAVSFDQQAVGENTQQRQMC
jgi:hypothetical protein